MLASSVPINWDQLANDFKEQRCIFLLGPGIANVQAAEQLVSMETALALHISKILDQYDQSYETEGKTRLNYMAERFLDIPRVRRVDLEDVTRKFYAEYQDAIPPTYSILADFPASIIVNTSPDNFMVQALLEKEKDPMLVYYNFRLTQYSRRNQGQNNQANFDLISPSRPLVFNLFGHLDNPESMVLTMEDQMEFIRNVVKGDPPIPSELLSNFDDRKTYILLGFDLNNWQFRLLLDSLNIQKENTTILPYVDDSPLNSITKIFYEKRFNCLFLKAKTGDFASQLRDQVITTAVDKQHRIFIAYHVSDKEILEGLLAALKTWEQADQLHIWHIGKLKPGDNREQKTKEALMNANTILLLMSAQFLADDDLFDHELDWAIEQAQEGKAKVFPVIARPCDWRANRDLRRLNPIPADGHAINDTEHWSSKDEAFYEIVQQLKSRLR